VHLQLTPINSALKFFFALGVHPHPLHPLTAPIPPNPRGGASTKVNHLKSEVGSYVTLVQSTHVFSPITPLIFSERELTKPLNRSRNP